jgi:hypothetical protein
MFWKKSDERTDRIHSASPARKYGILGKFGILAPKIALFGSRGAEYVFARVVF